ncbi:D-2-hydroxyacid dehydrogenase [Ferrimicrobium sp.]|uniref:D-2-hydroxyacid dehydrogenase n=1 Tax=Ferrimicrobium sp. TaxID=2926050 RepID=UPI002615C668|nr:D-2-hydroxyacid dehydrogenase [Ferrimicrobium sp.]
MKPVSGSDHRAKLRKPSLAVVRDGENPSDDCLESIADQVDLVVVSEGGVGNILDEAEILFVWPFAAPQLQKNWQSARALKWVHTATAGVDGLMFKELRESDVLVTNSRGVFERPIAEYTMGLLLAFAKDFRTTFKFQEEFRWEHRETARLDRTKLLIVGAGPIGREVGRMARNLGLEVTVVARHRRTDDADFGVVLGIEDLYTALPDSDFVVLATPLTDETRGMIGFRAIESMKAGSYLVNIGRGPVVDEGALLAGLDAGRVAGAALDVFEHEPLPQEHPFWTRSNVVVSPHMSADARGWQTIATSLFSDNLQRYLAGEPLINSVNKLAGYGSGDLSRG